MSHAHFSAHTAWTVTFAHLHACAHTRMAQVQKVFVACVSFLSISLSLFHVSPVSAVPVHPLRYALSVHVLAVLTCPGSAGHAHLRTTSEKFGYLACGQ